MKKLLLPVLLLFPAFLFSQKMIEANRVWTFFNYDSAIVFPEPPHPNHFISYYALRDTLIENGLEYIGVKYSPSCYEFETCETAFMIDTGYWVREDENGRVYLKDSISEQLIYDFSLNINDVFQQPNGELITLDAVDSVEIFDGTIRERFIFDNGEQWIKGIGSDRKFIGIEESAISMHCAKINCELVYNVSTNNAECCYSLVNNNDLESFNFSVFPNPVLDILTISSPHKMTSPVRCFNIKGNLLSSFPANHQYEMNLDLSNFEQGIYWIEIEGILKKIIKK